MTPGGEIVSAERADAVWEAHTLDNRRPLTGRTAPAPRSTSTYGEASVDLPEGVPPLAESRARREAALAEIAEAEARQVTGGRWLPVVAFEELEAKYLAFFSQCVRVLRERMPMAIHRRLDVHSLARVCAEAGARVKHVCGEPMAPLSDPHTVFRVAMHEIELAVDEVCTELSHMKIDDEDDPEDLDDGGEGEDEDP